MRSAKIAASDTVARSSGALMREEVAGELEDIGAYCDWPPLPAGDARAAWNSVGADCALTVAPERGARVALQELSVGLQSLRADASRSFQRPLASRNGGLEKSL